MVPASVPVPGSLSEGAGSPQGLTEGVSSDGSSMPTIYTSTHINSEIFDPLRSPKYTPSASLRSAAPSEREPGRGLYHSPGYSLKSGVSGDFHRPYETLMILDFTIQRTTLPQSRPLGVPAPSEREPGMGFHHSSGYSLKFGVAGDFHRPYGTLVILGFTIQRTTLPQSRPFGRDSSLREGAGRAFTIHPGTR